MSIGSRLEAALSLLALCGRQELFADIGSDHAFLAIEAKKRDLVERAVASDINKLPLEKGRENAANQGIEMDFILSDGFDALDDLGVTAAAICGMGGELIAKIILRSYTARNCYLILQPMSAQEDLRKALWDNGFEIIAERFEVESGKPYTIILTKHCGCAFNYSFSDLYLGKMRPSTPEFAKYCEKIYSSAIKRRIGIVAQGGSTEEIDKLLEECQTHITN